LAASEWEQANPGVATALRIKAEAALSRANNVANTIPSLGDLYLQKYDIC
jgi:hypothetical protein